MILASFYSGLIQFLTSQINSMIDFFFPMQVDADPFHFPVVHLGQYFSYIQPIFMFLDVGFLFNLFALWVSWKVMLLAYYLWIKVKDAIPFI